MAVQWVEIDTQVLLAAMKRKGLSYESFARQIPISAKTAERWVKAGRVQLWHVDKVAEILDLEIERPAFAPAAVRVAHENVTLADLAEEAAAQRLLLERLLELLERDGAESRAGTRRA